MNRIITPLLMGLIAMARPSWALPLDESATFAYASRDAKLYWNDQGLIHLLGNQDNRRLLEFTVEDQNRARPLLLKLPFLDYQQPQIVLLLQSTGGKGTADFFSKEAPDLKAPNLLLYTDEQEHYIEANIDTFLGPAIRKPQGQAQIFKVGGERLGLISFKIPEDIHIENVQRAELLLQLTDKQYGNSEISLTQLAIPESYQQAESGLAAQYPTDKNINHHPGVYYADNFDRESWLDTFSEAVGQKDSRWSNAATLDYVTHQHTEHFLDDDGRSALARFDTDKNLALNLDYYFKRHHDQEPEEAYFRYYLKLAPGANISGGGKLPGFGGTYGKAGWGGRGNDGYQGWSARGAFFESIDNADSPWLGHMPIGSYLYEADSSSKYGSILPWGHPLSTISPGRWYSIEQHLRLNTPGQSDGLLEVWVDGVQILHKTDLMFRKTDELKIEKIWFNFYFGGVDKPKYPFDMYIDNIVIASEYIGPVKQTE
ncbi:polysaccharide lyase [Lacimicrobium alkaliphilum]|uniref:Polysaccharide lyase 14 domain-containing protein n=1 Tax=Lacimicrobium alkaliphilum TaxID=1526571 RepID=A0ABQ1RMX1_9ALTE|nr:hypothetical protein [Lacimicrobium alkaliphilum]GGD75225.1 hypothetical protein GCM10011357_32790 [Lacimicrobium alkaliphilum]